MADPALGAKAALHSGWQPPGSVFCLRCRSSTGAGATTATTFISDGVAALIVTIMLIPQSLAYALLAGLPPEVGLYASVAPLLLYAVFGTSRVLAVGPVAVVSLMTAAAIGEHAAPGSAGLLGGGHHAGLPVGCRCCWRWGCCGWASWPTSSATR